MWERELKTVRVSNFNTFGSQTQHTHTHKVPASAPCWERRPLVTAGPLLFRSGSLLRARVFLCLLQLCVALALRAGGRPLGLVVHAAVRANREDPARVCLVPLAMGSHRFYR